MMEGRERDKGESEPAEVMPTNEGEGGIGYSFPLIFH
jgi:hypothetical protein